MVVLPLQLVLVAGGLRQGRVILHTTIVAYACYTAIVGLDKRGGASPADLPRTRKQGWRVARPVPEEMHDDTPPMPMDRIGGVIFRFG